MNVSVVVIGGYFKHSDQETDRVVKFTKCLKALNRVHFEEGDEVVISEYGMKKMLDRIAKQYLKKPFQHVFTEIGEGEYFNQSIAKNRGTAIAKGDIILYINSDILLRDNFLDVLKKSFQYPHDKKFVICPRHDIFVSNVEVDSLIDDINNSHNYQLSEPIKIQDPGWLYALDVPSEHAPSYRVYAFFDEKYRGKIMHDFMQGYFVFGDSFAVTKKTWEQFPFDENCFALTDVFYRDFVLNHGLNGYVLNEIGSSTSCFHLSGDDYAQQTQKGSEKETRLLNDQVYLAEKYDECKHWIILGYHREYDEMIKKTGLDAKAIVEKYRTPVYWKYFTDKQEFCDTYGVSYNLE